MLNLKLLFLFLALLTLLGSAGGQAQEPQQQEAVTNVEETDIVPAEPAQPPQAQAPSQEQQQQPAEQAASPQEGSAVQPVASKSFDERDEFLFSRIKEVVKKMDKANKKGISFPVKPVEIAIRSEFMRRAEGNHSLVWIHRSQLRDSDKNVALDNLELLVNYARHLLALNTPARSKKKGKAQELELKLQAAKAVIDDYNSRRSGDRSLASLSESPTGLGKVGKEELARRRRLVGRLVAGSEYRAPYLGKIEDYGKALMDLLSASVREYEKFAAVINASDNGAGRKKSKSQ